MAHDPVLVVNLHMPCVLALSGLPEGLGDLDRDPRWELGLRFSHLDSFS
jgi:hypothetical protein